MRRQGNMFVFILILILGTVLLSGCGTLGAGSAEEGDSGDGGAGGGSSNDDETSGDEEDGALDEIDLSMGCPEEPYVFGVYLDYQVNIEEDNGYIYERTDPFVGVWITIQGSQISSWQDQPLIPVTIEGVSDDCTISGNATISLAVSGICLNGMANLDIRGTYQSYFRSIQCPGQSPVNTGDAQFAGPSITDEFNLSESGYTVDQSYAADAFEFIYRWTLQPIYDVPAEGME